MATNRLSWNQMVAGARPRGSGDLKEVRKILWRWIRIAEEGVFDSLAERDKESMLRFMHIGAILLARYRDVMVDVDLSTRLDEALGKRRDGAVPSEYTYGIED